MTTGTNNMRLNIREIKIKLFIPQVFAMKWPFTILFSEIALLQKRDGTLHFKFSLMMTLMITWIIYPYSYSNTHGIHIFLKNPPGASICLCHLFTEYIVFLSNPFVRHNPWRYYKHNLQGYLQSLSPQGCCEYNSVFAT